MQAPRFLERGEPVRFRSCRRELIDAGSSDAADTTVVAKVQGQDVLAQSPNKTIDLKDPVTGTSFGFVILNEQVCDGGADLPKCAKGNHAGLTVRGIRLVITVPENPLGLKAGATIIVAEAHSDATFGS